MHDDFFSGTHGMVTSFLQMVIGGGDDEVDVLQPSFFKNRIWTRCVSRSVQPIALANSAGSLHHNYGDNECVHWTIAHEPRFQAFVSSPKIPVNACVYYSSFANFVNYFEK